MATPGLNRVPGNAFDGEFDGPLVKGIGKALDEVSCNNSTHMPIAI